MDSLSIDTFIKTITYLPIVEVNNICQLNHKLYEYCNNIKYNNNWKMLIDDTYSNINDYQNKLNKVWLKLNLNKDTYNYIIYTKLINELDPITQAMIYYRQGDLDNFEKLTKNQKFLSLFLLGDLENIKKYLPKKFIDQDFIDQDFIDLINGKNNDLNILNYMMSEFAKEGNVKGVALMINKGADIHYLEGENVIYYFIDRKNTHFLDILKFMYNNGGDIFADRDYALYWASGIGDLDIVKFLVEKGATGESLYGSEYLRQPLVEAVENNHLDVVKYLIKKGAVDTSKDVLFFARKNNNLAIINYLEKHLK